MDKKLIVVIAAILIIAVVIFNGNTIKTNQDCMINRMPINTEYRNYICIGLKSPIDEKVQVNLQKDDICYRYVKGEKCSGIQIPTFIFDRMIA